MEDYKFFPISTNSSVNIERAGTDLIISSFTFKCMIIAPNINIANEIYNVSDTTDSETSMYRQVLGEKLKEYFTNQDQLIRGMLESVKGVVNTMNLLFDSYIDHTHTIPEINVDIPDKEVSFNDLINLGIKMEPQPPISIFVPSVTVDVPGSGSRTITNVVQTPFGPRTYTEDVAGTPGSSVTIPSKFISVPQPDKAVNKGYRAKKRTKIIIWNKKISKGECKKSKLTQ